MNAVEEAPVVQSLQMSKDTGPPPHCTGEAMQCAVDLAIFGPHQEPQSSRLVLITNGCPNVSIRSIVNCTENDEGMQQNGNRPHPLPYSIDTNQMTRAVQYFEVTGKYATNNGIGIDVFCTGTNFASP